MEKFKTYSERILTANPVVMGLRLKTFTLGHSILLKRYKSRFLSGDVTGLTDKDIIPELMFAVLICSTTYDAFNAEVESGEFRVNANEHIQWFNSKMADKEFKFCLLVELQKFGEYLKSGTATPKFMAKDDKDTVTNTPFEFEETIKDLLMTEKGYTRDECLNLPYPEILSAFFLHAHNQGFISLQGENEWKLIQHLKGNK